MQYRMTLKWGILFTGALVICAPLFAQQKSKNKKEKEEVIVSENKKKEKLTIIVDGDNVTVNGKPIDQYNGSDIIIRKRGQDEFVWNNDNFNYKFRTPRIAPTPHVYVTPTMPPMPPMAYSTPGDWNFNFDFDHNSKKAILGVTTEDDAKGAKIKEVMKESAAEKAGLKSGDIITQVNGKKVDDAETLSDLIDDKDPGDEIELTYLREKKTQKVKVKLGERKQQSYSRSYRAPRIQGFEKMEPPYNYSFGYNRHRLGLRIQEMEDSSGVKVLEVEEESLAEKAGVKRDDVITEIDGKKVKDTYSARDAMNDSSEKNNFTIKVLRGGSPVNLEVKIPKVLKKSDL